MKFAAIVSDANARPEEGGNVLSAIHGRFEERGGDAILFAQYYTVEGKAIQLGELTLRERCIT
ncbi:MAG TPA: hypothetical protein VII63_00065 [Caulobacteraceae bacterium]